MIALSSGEARATRAIARLFELHALSAARGLESKDRIAQESYIGELARLPGIEVAHGVQAFVRLHAMSEASATLLATRYADVAALIDKGLAPAQPTVNVHLPPRRTDGIVERNDRGEIVRTVTVERDDASVYGST